jgi:hypothetical protein
MGERNEKKRDKFKWKDEIIYVVKKEGKRIE